jgi:hypothetical protein
VSGGICRGIGLRDIIVSTCLRDVIFCDKRMYNRVGDILRDRRICAQRNSSKHVFGLICMFAGWYGPWRTNAIVYSRGINPIHPLEKMSLIFPVKCWTDLAQIMGNHFFRTS